VIGWCVWARCFRQSSLSGRVASGTVMGGERAVPVVARSRLFPERHPFCLQPIFAIMTVPASASLIQLIGQLLDTGHGVVDGGIVDGTLRQDPAAHVVLCRVVRFHGGSALYSLGVWCDLCSASCHV
jgi:hypothetical protein